MNEDELEKGDFVYQSDQELFLVVMGVQEDSYNFAVHGWRNIGKERLAEYIDHQNGKLYRQDQIEELVENEADEETAANFEKLMELFESYEQVEFEEEGPHTDFALEDT